MGTEIERKFLVKDDGWRTLATGQARIRQAYLALGGKATIRVRVKDDRAATLTIKPGISIQDFNLRSRCRRH